MHVTPSLRNSAVLARKRSAPARGSANQTAAMSTLVEQTKARKDYHAKWDAIATAEVQRVEDEDALDKQASSLSLGTDRGPKSEAEAGQGNQQSVARREEDVGEAAGRGEEAEAHH